MFGGITLVFLWLAAAHVNVQICESARVLMMPFYHYSMVNALVGSGKALRSAGHDVSVLAPDFFKAKIEKAKLKAIVYLLSKEADFREAMDSQIVGMFTGEKGILDFMGANQVAFNNWANELLCKQYLLDEIRRQNFDLAIIDGSAMARHHYLIAYKYDIPYITFNPILDPWAAGVPAMPSLEPMSFFAAEEVTNQMTFFQRTTNLLKHIGISILAGRLINVTDTSFYAPEKEIKTLNWIHAHSELFLNNAEVNCFDFPRVSAPNYQFISGASVHPPEPLPANIEEFVADAKDGVIIVTFGSLRPVRKVLPFIMEEMLGAFARLKQKVILAYEPEKLKDFTVPKNVLALDWLPQNDILGHNKTRLFVTHAGLNGQLESLYHAVPMVAIPFDLDQKYNARRAKTKGYGEVVEMHGLTSEDLYNKIQKVLNDEIYRKNIEKCSRIVQKMPSPKETLIFWVNHILEFGGEHLRLPSIDMPLYKVFMIDVLLFLSLIVYVVVKVVILILKAFFKRLCRRDKVKSD